MPTYTEEVDAEMSLAGGTTLTPTGTGNIITALTDGSDSTYGKANAASVPAGFRVYDPTYGSGEKIVSVCVWCRHSCPGTKNVQIFPAVRRTVDTVVEGTPLVIAPGSAADYAVDAHQGQLLDPYTGRLWAQTGNALALTVRDPHTSSANRALWYEAGLAIYTLKPATIATPSAPSGTITSTQKPDCTAQISAVVESWQVPSGESSFLCGGDVWFAIYNQADIGTATSPPPGAVPVWTSVVSFTEDTYIDGSTPSTQNVTATPEDPLPNGDYALFVKAQRDLPDGSSWYSAWAHRHFTMAFVAPTAPSLTPTADATHQCMGISVTVSATSGYTSSTAEVDIQRQTADGWQEVRSMSSLAVAVGSAVDAGDDYECLRSAGNVYRARVSMVLTATGVRYYSAWTTAASVNGPAPTGTGWNIKALDLPASNWVGAPVVGEPEEASLRETAVFAPLERDLPVVVSGYCDGVQGRLELEASGSTEVAALEALVEYAGLCYLETAFGDVRYIVLTGRSWTRRGTASGPVRVASVDYVETNSGLETVSS